MRSTFLAGKRVRNREHQSEFMVYKFFQRDDTDVYKSSVSNLLLSLDCVVQIFHITSAGWWYERWHLTMKKRVAFWSNVQILFIYNLGSGDQGINPFLSLLALDFTQTNSHIEASTAVPVWLRFISYLVF